MIKDGVSSYTPSYYPNYYTRVDLKKSDTVYEAYTGNVEHSWIDGNNLLQNGYVQTGVSAVRFKLISTKVQAGKDYLPGKKVE